METSKNKFFDSHQKSRISEVILDTNFILTCMKQKIDFFSQLDELLYSYKIIIPERVIKELSKLKETADKIEDREAAGLALQLIEKSDKIKIIMLKGNVDEGIVNYALKNEVIVASLDRGIKSQLKGKRFLTIKKRKRISLA